MQVTFWGVRGSIPACGVDYAEFGGHTSCVQVSAGDAILIFDLGTGAQALGQQIMREMSTVKANSLHIFLSHYHLDHVSGLPFFRPLYSDHSKLYFYGMDDVQTRLQQFMGPPYFPVHLQDTLSEKHYCSLLPNGSINITDSLQVTNLAVTHPGGCRSFRVDYQEAGDSVVAKKSLVYLTDYEHGLDNNGDHDKLVAFCQGVDLLIYDACFTDEQFKQNKGYGHSTWRAGVNLAQEARVKNLACFHHGINCSDKELRQREQEAQQLFADSFFAREQQAYTIK